MSGTTTSSSPLSVVPEVIPASALLPPVDAVRYPDLLVTNTGTAVWLSLGDGVPVGPGASGTYEIPSGGGILIVGTAANATAVTVLAQMRGGLLTFQRASPNAIIVFPILRR